ncbi:acylneuraminate cytidylyltransferase family protein [Halodesulfovibrio marinisediminis]|uniref:N-acylneuraminate cytidylyltransferase n=1 Tax=Halodesulfovibrio marinisediminis DSM 17456 TaxID=1121457 RepID=A0A1N6FTJ7_9BACT|nr:acylneuraminate cytidylyltransferase family protein [Halodesulfovibrio marinisediminis]SIN98639.1 N-acylneuraminate cytidylyltransferase [Halodesulfovibrio marinisediminis DSM 17456]
MVSHGFVFARGGSKGLPGKNIKKLCGKPLLQYSIEVAKQVQGLDKVFVSTDDEEIASVAESVGAIVIPRPKALAEDTTPEWLAWIDAVKWVEKKYGHFHGFVSLPATSPLRSVEDVVAAMDRLKNSKADICIAVTAASRSPYFNMVKINEEGLTELVCSDGGNFVRRQDVPRVYDITTAVYATTASYVLNGTGVLNGKTVAIEIPKERAVDIDDIYDFKFAEAILMTKGSRC